MRDLSQEKLELDFPCDFPIKVVGVDQPNFISVVHDIAQKHDGSFDPNKTTEKHSRNGKYLSLTIAITAVSMEQIHAIYADLKQCESVVWAL